MIAFIALLIGVGLWVAHRGTRDLIEALTQKLEAQQSEINALTKRLRTLEPVERPAAPAAAPRVEPTPAPQPVRPPVVTPPPVVAVPPRAPIEPVSEPPGATPISEPTPTREPEPVSVSRPSPPPLPRPPLPRPPVTPPPPPPSQPPIAPEPAEPLFKIPAFDWEQLVGVRLFSAIAGIALVFAGVFFLRYSIEHGWLQPRVRVIIGTVVGIALLAVCERKAARKYPVTANALDAAAIAILFSTFFSAHALWNLVSQTVAFGLLALVAATAVGLSIRRDSLFIAVLGLLGGFATPILLSSGENRPIGLFSYLMLLNVGLAWVAYRRGWPILTALSMVLTTVYQWGWVMKFLDASQLPLAVGIFIVFAVVGFAGLLLSTTKPDADSGHDWLPAAGVQKMALGAAAMPLLFAIYFAAVPAYRDNFWLLFGFLLIVDAGLLAIAAKRNDSLTHVLGALLTVLVFGVWMAMSYTSAAWPVILPIASVFVVLYLFGPSIADRIGEAFDDVGLATVFAAPLLLFVFVALARIEPAADAPWTLFGVLMVLLVLIAWRAIVREQGTVYYVGAFFALAAEALWSTTHLRTERLRDAIALYAAFGVLYLAVPAVARRLGKPLEPAGAPGGVLLASIALLLFLTSGPVAPVVLWGLALLLAILNAAIFVESAAVRMPILSFSASAASWVLLGHWWYRSAGAIGLLPSLLVLVGLTLLMVAGYSWTRRQVAQPADETQDFRYGFYLALVGHLFLSFFAAQARWSIPPWPLFGALLVMTLALLTPALAFRDKHLHVATIVAAAVVLLSFVGVAAPAPWPSVAIGAFAALSALALFWIPVSTRAGFETTAAAAAAASLVIGVLGAIVADTKPGGPSLALLLSWHVSALIIILFLTTRYAWPFVTRGAAALAGLVVGAWAVNHDAASDWIGLLVFTSALFAIFAVYPITLGSRGRESREPYIAAIGASAWAFFAARHAFEQGGLTGIVGIVPVVLGAVMAVHLRQLLRVQPQGERDLGRLALVAAASLAFVTVAIPLQLEEQWITIGWALEGAALAWLYGRIPHRGLLLGATALLAVVFVRLALNPAIFIYEPRGSMRILNWYLYAYAIAAAAMFFAAWRLSKTEDSVFDKMPRISELASAAGVILLFILLNIEIADFYAAGPEIMFRFGVSIQQDLTYTIGWLVFGLVMLAAGITLGIRNARVTAVALIAVTTLKCFLYDLRSLEGLYRVAAFVGLAVSLILVSLALQKFVLRPREKTA